VADDLIVVINGNSQREIEQRGQEIVDEILDWCRLAKLKISKNKTEGIALKTENIKSVPLGRRGEDRPDRKQKQVKEIKVYLANRPSVIKVDSIKFKKSVRYLGFWLDQGMSIKSHCEILRDRIDKLFANLG